MWGFTPVLVRSPSQRHGQILVASSIFCDGGLLYLRRRQKLNLVVNHIPTWLTFQCDVNAVLTNNTSHYECIRCTPPKLKRLFQFNEVLAFTPFKYPSMQLPI